MQIQLFIEKFLTETTGQTSPSLLVAGTLVVIGFLSNYMLNINFLKQLRSGTRKLKPRDLIVTAIFFGGPVLLLFYMFDDYRAEDKDNKNQLLITGIVTTVFQIALLIILGATGVIKI